MILLKPIMIVIVLVLAIIMHELGHFLWFWRNKGVGFNFQWFYNTWTDFGIKSVWNFHLTPEEEINSLLFGIFFGLCVVFGAILLTPHRFFIFALPIYMGGCRPDLLRLVEIIKNQNKLGVGE